MKKGFFFIALTLSLHTGSLCSQAAGDTLVYLLTCGPGTETYSIYGHSALRIIYPEKRQDLVFNWGVFDFDTPAFAWKFAKGRLDYMLAVESMQGFIQSYFQEKRYVQCQKLNITKKETEKLIALINENLKPENINYRYDFFYDDCSTRIRDLVEKAAGGKLLYPPVVKGRSPTFRELIHKYQINKPWLNFGVDLLVGSPADRKAPYRDRMFLPFYLQKELSEAEINREGKMVPLLTNPDFILDFDNPVIKQQFLLKPAFVFTLFFIVVMILSAAVRGPKFNFWFDTGIYTIFSVLAVMMIFFNFFTDHEQCRWNLNIIWLNPFIIFCLFSIILGRPGIIWFRLLFGISAAFLVLHALLPQSFNIANLPLLFILIIRSSMRSDFEWNPLSVKQ